MSGKFLLDTNIVVALFNNDKAVINKLKKATEIFIPSITIGELYFGAEKSEHKKSNAEKISELVNITTIIPCDQETAKHYGKIKNHLKSKGTPIPENDIWIAAIAKQYDFILVTRDQHFKHIDKLIIDEW